MEHLDGYLKLTKLIEVVATLLTELENDGYNLYKTFYAAIAYHKNVLHVKRDFQFFNGRHSILGLCPNMTGWEYVLQTDNDS